MTDIIERTKRIIIMMENSGYYLGGRTMDRTKAIKSFIGMLEDPNSVTDPQIHDLMMYGERGDR